MEPSTRTPWEPWTFDDFDQLLGSYNSKLARATCRRSWSLSPLLFAFFSLLFMINIFAYWLFPASRISWFFCSDALNMPYPKKDGLENLPALEVGFSSIFLNGSPHWQLAMVDGAGLGLHLQTNTRDLRRPCELFESWASHPTFWSCRACWIRQRGKQTICNHSPRKMKMDGNARQVLQRVIVNYKDGSLWHFWSAHCVSCPRATVPQQTVLSKGGRVSNNGFHF